MSLRRSAQIRQRKDFRARWYIVRLVVGWWCVPTAVETGSQNSCCLPWWFQRWGSFVPHFQLPFQRINQGWESRCVGPKSWIPLLKMQAVDSGAPAAENAWRGGLWSWRDFNRLPPCWCSFDETSRRRGRRRRRRRRKSNHVDGVHHQYDLPCIPRNRKKARSAAD